MLSQIKRSLLIEPGRNILPSLVEQIQGVVEEIPIVDGSQIPTWDLPGRKRRLKLPLQLT